MADAISSSHVLESTFGDYIDSCKTIISGSPNLLVSFFKREANAFTRLLEHLVRLRAFIFGLILQILWLNSR